MGLPLRIARVCASANIAGALLALTCGDATAGGFGVEQSAYFQGMSFAGAAAGGPSLASISWNPATAGLAGNGLTMESSYSVVLMSAGVTVLNPQDQLTTGPSSTEMARNALVGASYATWRLNDKMVLGLSLTSPFGLGTKAENQDWVGSYEGGTTSLVNLNAAPMLSYEIAPGVTVAGGLQIDYFELQRQTAGTPFGTANLRADDIGVGFVAGIDYAPTRSTSVGLGFRSSVDHTLEGHLTL